MRETQELLEQQFEERSKRFLEEFDSLSKPEEASGIRLTAIPAGGDVHLDSFFTQGGHGKLSELSWCAVRYKGENVGHFPFGFSQWSWLPTLRAARVEKLPYSGSEPKSYGEINWNGMVELGFVLCPLENESTAGGLVLGKYLLLDWLVALLATLGIWVNRVREFAGTPTAEYALEIEIYSKDGVLMLLESEFRTASEVKKWLEPGSMKFPRYPLGDPDNVPDLLASFFRDCWHLAGRHIEVKASDFEI